MSTGCRGIVLFGATGYTGRLIARRLDARGIPFTLAARDETRARALQAELGSRVSVAIVDMAEPAMVRRALEDAGIVVNCVGPYNLYGDRVLRECTRRDVVYLDLSGEQEFVRRSLVDPERAQWSATVLHSVAFESALADLLAAETLDTDAEYRSICSIYSFSKSRPSPGTHLTMRIAPWFPTYRLRSGTLVRAAPLSFAEQIDLGGPEDQQSTCLFMPYPEIFFFADRYRTADASSFLRMSEVEARFARAAGGHAPPPLATVLEQARRRHRDGPTEQERRRQQFRLAIHAVDADGGQHTREIRGFDMYGVTALLVLRVLEALRDGLELPSGPLAPASLPVWEGFWRLLQREGCVEAMAEVG